MMPQGLAGQDLAALAICLLAFTWLVRRLLLSNAPRKKPALVTPAALLRRTAEQRSRTTPPSSGCH